MKLHPFFSLKLRDDIINYDIPRPGDGAEI